MNHDPGFWLAPDLLMPQECDRLAERIGRGDLARSRAGARHLMAERAVRELANDQRLLQIASASLGVDRRGGTAAPFRATLFEKSGQSNWLVVWHQDTALPLASRFEASEWGPWSEKAGILYAHAPAWALARVLALRVHLDDSGVDNGPLRCIPHSHCLGVLSDEDVFRVAKEQPSETCQVARGGVLAMRPLVIHSSSKSASEAPRRVLHIEYADALDLAPGIRLAVA